MASVVAESEDIAREALELIVVQYEVLIPLTDMEKALNDDSPQIHKKGNLLSETIVDRGNIEDAMKETMFISKGTYETQMVEHAFMETETSVAQPWQDGDRNLLARTRCL